MTTRIDTVRTCLKRLQRRMCRAGRIRVRYPVVSFIVVAVAITLMPPISWYDVRASVDGPVAVGLVGLMTGGVSPSADVAIVPTSPQLPLSQGRPDTAVAARKPISSPSASTKVHSTVATMRPCAERTLDVERGNRKRVVAGRAALKKGDEPAIANLMGPAVRHAETGEDDASSSTASLARFVAVSDDAVVRTARPKVVANPLPYSGMIEQIAREHGVSPALAAAVIKVESGFKANARSRRGARGLMQLLPATARTVGVRENIYDPEYNIRAGVRYLRMMLDRYNGDEKLALAAYNAGPGAVDRYNSVPPYRETKQYVPRVLEYVREYAKYFSDI